MGGRPGPHEPQQTARLADRADDRPRLWTAYNQYARHHAEHAHPEHTQSCATAATARVSHRHAEAAVADARRQHAVHDGIPARAARSRRTSPEVSKPRPYVATTGRVWALHDAVPEHLRPAIPLGAFVGLRTAEVVGPR